MPDNRTEIQLGQKPTAAELIPDFAHKRVVASFAFFSFCSAVVISTARIPWHPDPLTSFWVLQGLLAWTCGLWLLALKLFLPVFQRWQVVRIYTTAWSVLVAIGVFSVTLFHGVAAAEFANTHMPAAPSIVIVAALGAFALRYFYLYVNWRVNQQRGQIARSQALAARIRPHFLFNTLNTIAELTRADPEAAEHAVEDLARLYRTGLANVQHKVDLGDEINTAKSYLYIEQYRLGSRMQQSWDTDQLPKDAQLPILTLQPLVENAVYHGIEPCPDGGKLFIKGWVEDKTLCIMVSNPMPDIERSNRQKGNNMAVENIRQRLQMAFGKRASMQTEKHDQQYQVTLRFPYVTGDTQG
jgi:two-component system sensor histidine kinase AlgZ